MFLHLTEARDLKEFRYMYQQAGNYQRSHLLGNSTVGLLSCKSFPIFRSLLITPPHAIASRQESPLISENDKVSNEDKGTTKTQLPGLLPFPYNSVIPKCRHRG